MHEDLTEFRSLAPTLNKVGAVSTYSLSEGKSETGGSLVVLAQSVSSGFIE